MKKSEFSSRGKTGHFIDWAIIVLFCSQLALLLIQIAVHNRIPWVLLFIPLYVILVPLVLIWLGAWLARH